MAYEEQQKALGQGGLTAVEVLKLIASGNIKVTPDTLISSTNGGSGGDNGTLSGLITYLLTQAMKGSTEGSAPAIKLDAKDETK